MAPRNETEVRITGKDLTAQAFKSLHGRIKNTTGELTRFNKASLSAAKGFAGFAGALTGLGVGAGLNELAAGLKKNIDELDKLIDLSNKTGTSLQKLRVWGAIAEQNGMNQEQWNSSIEAASKSFAQLQKGVGKLPKFLEKNDKALYRNLKSAKDLDDYVGRAFEAIRRQKGPAAQGLMSQMLFGDAGVAVMVRQGKKGLTEMRKEIERLFGPALTKKQQDAIAAYNDEIALVGVAWKGVMGQVSAEWSTAFQPILSDLKEFLAANQNAIKEGAGQLFREMAAGLKEADWKSIGAGLGTVGQGLLDIAKGAAEIAKWIGVLDRLAGWLPQPAAMAGSSAWDPFSAKPRAPDRVIYDPLGNVIGTEGGGGGGGGATTPSAPTAPSAIPGVPAGGVTPSGVPKIVPPLQENTTETAANTKRTAELTEKSTELKGTIQELMVQLRECGCGGGGGMGTGGGGYGGGGYGGSGTGTGGSGTGGSGGPSVPRAPSAAPSGGSGRTGGRGSGVPSVPSSPSAAPSGGAPTRGSGRGGGRGTNPEVVAYIRKRAEELGIDPNIAIRVAESEGLRGFDPNREAIDKGGDRGTSFGPFQLHYGGGPRGVSNKGLGDVFTARTGKHARENKYWREAIDFALEEAKKGGWGPWHGWRGPRWAGIGRGGAPSETRRRRRPGATAAPPSVSGLSGGNFPSLQTQDAERAGMPGLPARPSSPSSAAPPSAPPEARRRPSGGDPLGGGMPGLGGGPSENPFDYMPRGGASASRFPHADAMAGHGNTEDTLAGARATERARVAAARGLGGRSARAVAARRGGTDASPSEVLDVNKIGAPSRTLAPAGKFGLGGPVPVGIGVTLPPQSRGATKVSMRRAGEGDTPYGHPEDIIEEILERGRARRNYNRPATAGGPGRRWANTTKDQRLMQEFNVWKKKYPYGEGRSETDKFGERAIHGGPLGGLKKYMDEEYDYQERRRETLKGIMPPDEGDRLRQDIDILRREHRHDEVSLTPPMRTRGIRLSDPPVRAGNSDPSVSSTSPMMAELKGSADVNINLVASGPMKVDRIKTARHGHIKHNVGFDNTGARQFAGGVGAASYNALNVG